MKNHRFRILFTYLILVHCILFGVIASPEFYIKISNKLNSGINAIKVEYARASLHTMLRRKMENASIGSTIFIGDSLVQGLNTSVLGKDVVNLGIGHDQIPDVLKRLEEYPNLTMAKTIVIHVGINDIRNTNIDQVKDRFESLFAFVDQFKNIKVSGVLPIEDNEDSELAANINEINKFLDSSIRNHDNISYIPPPNSTLAPNHKLLSKYHIGDGLHLNRFGNHIWLNHLQVYIND